jgi:hypothetical protein
VEDDQSRTIGTPPESQVERTQSDEDFRKSFVAMVDWCKACQQHYGKLPDRQTISLAWSQLTGKELSDKALDYLIDKLFENLND